MTGWPEDHVSPDLPPIPRDLAALLPAIDGPTWEPTDAFRESLCSYVGALRANGVPPERMLTIVKRLLGPTARPSLAEQAIKWCIEAYFRPA